MIGLNIVNYTDNTGSVEMWPETQTPKRAVSAVTPTEEPIRSEKLDQRPDLFDLTRSISGRAYSRRRIQRSSSII